jgi:hypothetical protein
MVKEGRSEAREARMTTKAASTVSKEVSTVTEEVCTVTEEVPPADMEERMVAAGVWMIAKDARTVTKE